MSICCPPPKNNNNQQESCKLPGASTRAECPVSHALSRRVGDQTLINLLHPAKVKEIHKSPYYYCADPECPVVYFANDGHVFTIHDVSVTVLAKDSGEDVNVCYCFDWSRKRIWNEIEHTGNSTASEQIAKEIREGNCLCDIKNPKGDCCLGDIYKVVSRHMKEST